MGDPQLPTVAGESEPLTTSLGGEKSLKKKHERLTGDLTGEHERLTAHTGVVSGKERRGVSQARERREANRGAAAPESPTDEGSRQNPVKFKMTARLLRVCLSPQVVRRRSGSPPLVQESL